MAAGTPRLRLGMTTREGALQERRMEYPPGTGGSEQENFGSDGCEFESRRGRHRLRWFHRFSFFWVQLGAYRRNQLVH